MMKPIRSSRKKGERGATLILFTFLTVLVLIPVIGLAIDGAIVMWEKARLVQAVDAAALAAGRSLNVALGDQAQQATVNQIAETYFQANFQPGQMGTTEITPNLDGQQPSPLTSSGGYRKVTVARSISVPLYFMRMLGFNNMTMEATGQASRKDVNVILVLDRSGSMATSTNPNDPNSSTACDQMKNSAISFVNMFVDGRDSLGLVTFQTTANVDFPVPQDKKFQAGITQQLNQLVCAGATSSAWGLSLAYDQIKQSNLVGASNVIVFFSDGYPTSVEYSNANGYNSALPTRNNPSDYGDTRYDSINTGHEYQYPQSPCQSSSIPGGVLVAWEQYTYATGYTLGVAKDTPYPISSNEGAYLDVPHLAPAQGCSFTNPSSYAYYQYLPASYQQYYQNNPSILMRNDIAYIPTQDYYGNLTSTTQQGGSPHWPVVFFPSDGVHFYPGKIRPDVPQNLVYTALNAADNAAYRIRNDATYKPVIYSIGLGSDVNDDFMERVANDPRSSSYDASKLAGLYIKAPTATQLQSAFQQVASQVLRISQ